MKQKRVLPADVYDTLEFSALVFGGIGAGRYRDGGEPCCIVGHTMVASDSVVNINNDIQKEDATGWLNFAESDSDDAVHTINVRNGVSDIDARVPFADWCAELGVERGA